jgi:hypothetical protein
MTLATQALRAAIAKSGLTIYDSLHRRPDLYVDDQALEAILSSELAGISLDYPIRTRSKVLKTRVCQALGYPVPESFAKTQPRFPGQNFDTYVQKANNLQIWNEELAPNRRYVLIRVNELALVTRVRVVNGRVLAALDTTGTLTHKYQASSREQVVRSVLVSEHDTAAIREELSSPLEPGGQPLLPIHNLYAKLRSLEGERLPAVGLDQERNRGAELHRRVCEVAGISHRGDDGQYPDIPEQLLEVKLQTSPTIDLGVARPDESIPIRGDSLLTNRDVRYLVVYGDPTGQQIRLNAIVMTTGADFFSFFQPFGGKTRNSKLQIPLPSDFFE